jgi:uroporphyrin-III C-methyltransferase/precorrin-2 dehydrogenase/sirohydrochlorin ferrochelatase
MDYFPIFLKLQDAACLVVGGGDVALRKVRLLKAAGARLTVVAPEVTAELALMERVNCSGCRLLC